jgi:hypothetical protein
VAAGIEHGVEAGLVDLVERNGVGERILRGGIGAEPARRVGLRIGFIAARIERRLATGGEARTTCAPASTKT